MVREQYVRTCSYMVCAMVREKCVKPAPVCVAKPGHDTKTIDVCRLVPKKVVHTVTPLSVA